MPRRSDIETILVIGSGPIVIGQACEFDYSGTQACRVLAGEGYRVVLANSNPATIMTDPALADRTYVEPLDADVLERIIAVERPDAILPTLGGQTALNLAMELAARGVAGPGGVELIGATAEAIACAENRERFKDAMHAIGLEVPESGLAHSLAEALALGAEVGYPAIVRPSFILGGAGTGIARDEGELAVLAGQGLTASPVTEVLVEASIAGWKEFELEVMRDSADNCVVVCSIENFDPMGVHTGDSITVAPAQTLTDVEYQAMRDAAFAVIRKVGVETGGSNIQFAVHPGDGRMLVIEMNPRVSRSSALASKATGFPIAKIAARLAVGYRLDEIPNDITKKTPACFEPTIDYVVTKVPRWAFEKLPGLPDRLGTRMQSVGEVMAIGRTFCESLQKALRSLEQGRWGLNADPAEVLTDAFADAELVRALGEATPERPFQIEAALRRDIGVGAVAAASGVDPWFVAEIARITAERLWLESSGRELGATGLSRRDWRRIKRLGFSDAQVGRLVGAGEGEVRSARLQAGVAAVFKTVDTCAAEFAAETPYHYGCYDDETEIAPSASPVVVILGSGPNRIGQGIEFDYCCVHAAQALSAAGYETVMVNCNPETVSTDYDTSDRLFFEPLTAEDLANVLDALATACGAGGGRLAGVIVGLGGQTPLKLASTIPPGLVLGTTPEAIDRAEDRASWNALCGELGIPQAEGSTVTSLEEALDVAGRIGYPVLVRPSYVLGGRAMEIVYDADALREAFAELASVGSLGREGGLSAERPVLVDRFLEDAIEVDVDAVRDDTGEMVIAGVMEHVEEAGVHSGDSACALPPPTLGADVVALIEEHTAAIGNALGVVGPMNVQYAVKDRAVFAIEANPRASRTLPYVSKATGVAVARVAALVMVGETLASLRDRGLLPKDVRPGASGVANLAGRLGHVAVKEAVLPFNRFPEVDSLLGPEMRATGEVMGIDETFGLAFAKSQMAAGSPLPDGGCIFLSLADRDKAAGLDAARRFHALGFTIAATGGTAAYLRDAGVPVATVVAKRTEVEAGGAVALAGSGDPAQAGTGTGTGAGDAVDLISDGAVQLVVNTPRGRGARADGAYIRTACSAHGVPCLTTVAAARAAAAGIADCRVHGLSVMSLQERHRRGA